MLRLQWFCSWFLFLYRLIGEQKREIVFQGCCGMYSIMGMALGIPKLKELRGLLQMGIDT